MTQEPGANAPDPRANRRPTLTEALVPILSMALLLGVGYGVFGVRVELLLIASAIVTGVIGMRVGLGWRQMQEGIVESIGKAMPALLIVIVVGALIASWIVSGTIPMIVYYGLKIISPTWYLVTACVVCSVVSLFTGTSWGTIGTVGLALIGIAEGLGVPPGPAAGAIVAGSYFGDKLSPFSDTTNLAPIAARANLYDHIQHMLWTTTPAWLIGLLAYSAIGLWTGVEGDGAAVAESVAGISAGIREVFRFNILLLVPPVITLTAAVLKKPVIPGMLLSIAVAIVLALAIQDNGERVLGPPGKYEVDHPTAVRVLKTLVSGPSPDAGPAPTEADRDLDRIIGRGGMQSMMSTMLIALCAFGFAGIAGRAGVLEVLLEALTKIARTTGRLIAATVGASLLVAGITGNSYLAILVPGELFRDAFRRRGLAAKNLSRTTEDSGTVIVPLIPWSISAVFITETLGVAPTSYAPYAFMCYLGFAVAIFYGFTGLRIAPRVNEDETQPGS